MRTTIDTGWNIDHVRSSFWRLYLNASPGAAVVVSGRRIAITPCDLWVIPAWVMFDCRCTRPIDHTYLHFDVPGMPAERVRRLFDEPVHVGPAREIGGPIGPLQDGLGPDPQISADTICRAKALAFAVLGELIARLPPPQRQNLLDPMRGSHGLQPALRLVERSLHARLSNADLADACHLSEAQLVRKFRQVLGQTPAEYVADCRVSRASLALAYGNDSIEAIAEAHGFANRYHFSRVFRKRMGVPPAAYRRNAMV